MIQTKFYLALSKKQKRVYEEYFKNPNLTRKELAKKAGTGRTTVDSFLAMKELKEEVREIVGTKINSGDLVKIIETAIEEGKKPKGYRDRKLLLEAAGILDNTGKMEERTIEYHGFDKDGD